jgi:hypothetical protein
MSAVTYDHIHIRSTDAKPRITRGTIKGERPV